MFLLGEDNLPAFGVTEAGEGKKQELSVPVFPPVMAHPQVTPSHRRPPGSALYGVNQVLAAAALPPLAWHRASRRLCPCWSLPPAGCVQGGHHTRARLCSAGLWRMKPSPVSSKRRNSQPTCLFHHRNLPGITTDFLATLFPSPHRSFLLSTEPRSTVHCPFAELIPTAAPWKALLNTRQPCQQRWAS